MDLLYFLRVLYRRKWIIISLSFLAVVATFFFVLNQKPQFESMAQYSTGFTAEKVRLVDGTTAIDLMTADVKFSNAIETFKSPKVISRISYKLLLHDLEDPVNAYKKLSQSAMKSWIFKAVDRNAAKRVLADKISKYEMLRSDMEFEKLLLEYMKLYHYDYLSMLDALLIYRVERTDYLNVVFHSENAELSSIVVNSMGEEFLNYYKTLSSQRTEENAQTIKGMLDVQQGKVDSLTKRLLDEKVSQGTVDPVSRGESAMETVKSLETLLAEEKGRYNLHLNRISYLKENLMTLQSASAASNVNEEVVKLTNKKNSLVNELAKKGGKDPVLEQQINDLRAEIILKSNSGTSKAQLKENIDDLNRKISEEEAALNASASTITDYTSRINRYMGMINANPGSDIKVSAIKTQLEMENKQLSSFKEKYSQAQGLLRDDPTSNFVQTRIGQPAIEPQSKKTMIKMILAGASTFFLLAILFIFLEIFDSTLKTPSIFNKQSRIKTVNVLNHIKVKEGTFTDIILQDFDESRKFAPYNIFKNNIRKLRYEIENSHKHVFLITSTQQQSGKTAITESLAASLLLSKKRVLIIDLNFSNNDLTKQYATDVFIEDVVAKLKHSIPASIKHLCGNTAYENLSIIGCKEGKYTPSEVLYNIDMSGFLQQACREFDVVLIEGASLNDHADSKEIAQYADGVFTVVSATSSLSPADIESMKFLSAMKEKNHGVIFNNVLTENINS